MALNILFFIYGLTVMFYWLMGWIFWRRRSATLSRIVSVTMAVFCAQCVKDLFLLSGDSAWQTLSWQVSTGIDMMVVPLWVLVLIELVRPGYYHWKKLLIHMTPFVLLPIAYVIIEISVIYHINVAVAIIYSASYAVWVMYNIPKYIKWLKNRYSYIENLELKWLYMVVVLFMVHFAFWVALCFLINVSVEGLYLVVSMVIWMAILYFIYRHESVLLEYANDETHQDVLEDAVVDNTLAAKIHYYFLHDKAFLNPHLRLSDVVKAVGSNRNYVSNYINQEIGVSFYDYVNSLRVEHACGMLLNTDDSVEHVAVSSGFNSPATFYRVFHAVKGCTPSNFRRGETR